MSVGFHHGPLAEKYEKQANQQGFILGHMAGYAQKVGDAIVLAYMHGCITDREYDKILHRFQQKMIVRNLLSFKEEMNG